MANVNDLGLTSDDLGLDYAKIPEERGDFSPPLQPGTYLFQLPEDLSSVWEVIDRNGTQRLQAVLHGDNALIAHLPENEVRTFSAWISNVAYPRGNDKIPVSDMQYLIRVLDPSATPTTNPQFVDVLGQHGGDKFKASVSWSAYCNPNKNAYFEDTESGSAVEQEGTEGCSANYYQNQLPRDKDTGAFLSSFKCQDCNAVLRAFPKLRNFRSLDA